MAASCAVFSSAFVGSSISLRSVAVQKQTNISSRMTVRAEIPVNVVINPSVQKDVEKVADTVVVGELAKPVTAYCRCWRSKTFPLCDGTHVKHNKETGDNVGPLVLKK
eukprot:TRINITY_DN33225_c0_g1_i1.p1 TRINITY_DN33225_c0_g1~~TRINITY_DN33225_c0_g1_i1.p1  ORF type:complete len:108 (+),score=19.06 TRINITY_DN33225_c0_g1_i1:243-566(+)